GGERISGDLVAVEHLARVRLGARDDGHLADLAGGAGLAGHAIADSHAEHVRVTGFGDLVRGFVPLGLVVATGGQSEQCETGDRGTEDAQGTWADGQGNLQMLDVRGLAGDARRSKVAVPVLPQDAP